MSEQHTPFQKYIADSGNNRKQVQETYVCGRPSCLAPLKPGATTPGGGMDFRYMMCERGHLIARWIDLSTVQWAQNLRRIQREESAEVLKAHPEWQDIANVVPHPDTDDVSGSESLYGDDEFEGFD